MARKTVTVLFADVTGSTQLGEQLDPEVLRRVMTRYFETSRAILERHGATVEKFIGDAVMAVFGVPAVHEDDALRAARAALELTRDVAALGIELRIGVNTGEVVAEEGETLVTGDAVNVAARLEQAAAPGEILVGDATYRAGKEYFRAEAVAPVDAKGKREAVPAWRLLEVLDDAPAFTRPIATPFVGRRTELEQLVGAFDRAVETGAAQRVTLIGVPGIGKSRLARELVQQVAVKARVAVGRCLAYGDGITYWPLAEIVRATAGHDRDMVAAVVGDELVADRVAAAVGIGGVAGTKEELQWAARRYLEALAAERPLVVVLDDLHWAEPTFLDLVEYVADFAAAPMLLLCTARAELLDARPAWTAPRLNALVLALAPLADEDAAALAAGVDLAARGRILEAAEGNPLFVEQLLAFRAEGGDAVDLPPTLNALLAARIDSLLPAERVVVERASVEGRLFHRGSVVELAPEAVAPNVSAHLLALVRKQFVRPDRAQLPGDDGYRFAHVLVRDAAYESMAKELRAELHERFASWLERVAADRLAELEEILGYHFERAALYRRELGLSDESEVAGRAADLLARAGTRAYDRGDATAAVNMLARAVVLLPSGDALRVRVAPLLGAALRAAREMERALEVLAQALDEARATGDTVAEASAWALHRLIVIESVPGTDVERLHDEVAARAAEFEQLGDARALVFLRRLELEIGNILADDHFAGTAERLLTAARIAGDRLAAFQGLFFLNAAGVFGSTPVDEALAATQRSRTLAEGPLEEAAVENIEGLLRGMRGELDEGRTLVRKARATFTEFDVPIAVGTARDEALIARYAGDAAAAERTLRPACDKLRAAAETSSLSTLVAELADALYGVGRYDESEEATRESELTTQHADSKSQLTWRRVRAKLFARRGEQAAAIVLAHEAIEWARRARSLEDIGDAYLDLAEVERLTGRTEEAEEALEHALDAYEQKGLVPMAARTRKELEELRTTA